MVNSGLVSGKKSLKSVSLAFRLPYFTQWGQSILVSGSEPVLGSWNVKQGLLLSPTHQGGELVWSGRIAVPITFGCEYSYYLVGDDRNVLRWEAGQRRRLILPEGIQEGAVVELHDLWQTASEAIFYRSAFQNVIFNCGRDLHSEKAAGAFPDTLAQQGIARAGVIDQAGNASLENGPDRELTVDATSKSLPRYIFLSDGMFRETPWRGAGVAIPMFSVRSNDDLGVGEFLDLKLLVDWAVDSGFHLVQLLPVNDTSVQGMWLDSYPYSSLSVFALHPLYLRVQALSKNIPDEIKQEILEEKERLDQKAVDYEATMAAKLSISKKIFNLEKDEILSSPSFQKFFADNELEKLVSKDSLHYDVIRFHYYIQFHLHQQLSEAAAYARKKKVILKGDLPIGVDRNSVDTWVYPNLFRMNTSTGAPPDYFDKNGQNWGFPTYNWEEMSKDNYAWWRARLTQMAKYFTAYRIDHILGFFRIWELPEHCVTGLLGKFRPSIPLSQEELEGEGIWDFDRLSRPYMRQEILQGKFGTFWTVIAAHFFNEYQKNCYEKFRLDSDSCPNIPTIIDAEDETGYVSSFKEDCNTEKKILSKLETSAERLLWLDKEDKIRSDLFDLLKNIVLIRDPEDPKKFYPRFNLEDTSSFKDLDDHSKNVLKRLYYDYYFYRQENLWRQNALKTLPVLMSSSDMLACGEDLGLIPSCVHPVMLELGLIGLRIQRMPSEPDLEFGIPSQYSYMTGALSIASWADVPLRGLRSHRQYSLTRCYAPQHPGSPPYSSIISPSLSSQPKGEGQAKPQQNEENKPSNPNNIICRPRFLPRASELWSITGKDWSSPIGAPTPAGLGPQPIKQPSSASHSTEH
ncbi:4-alpha-glucanotransferase dpe2 [Asimina triloba]